MMEEKEKHSCPLLGVPSDTYELVSRTLYSRKAETSEEQRNFADNYKPVLAGQTGRAAVLPKKPSSRYPSCSFL